MSAFGLQPDPPLMTDPIGDLVFWRDCPARPCMVYVIQSGDAVKVGKALDIEDRLESLQCGNPVRLRLLHAIPGDHELETRLHRWLAPDRIHGEWFDGPIVPQVLTFLTALGEQLRSAYDGGQSAPAWKGRMTWPRQSLGKRRQMRPSSTVTVRHVEPFPMTDEEREAFQARRVYEAQLRQQRNEARLAREPNLA